MIKKFKNKGLKQLFTTGKTKLIGNKYIGNCVEILTMLDIAETPEEMNIAGYDFHGLKGNEKGRYSVSVNKNFRITFGWDEGAVNVDFEDYH